MVIFIIDIGYQPNIFYPGSAIPVAFGETDDATISLLSVGESFTKESITNLNLGIRQKKIFYLKTNELKKFLSITLKKYKNCIVKVCVDGTSQEFKKLKKSLIYKALLENDIKVVFKQSKQSLFQENKKILDSIDISEEKMTFSTILNSLVQKSKKGVIKHYKNL